MKALILVEHDNQQFKPSNAHVLTAAKQLNAEIDLLVIGFQCQKIADAATQFADIKRILIADDAVYEHQLAENSASLIADLAKNYDYILSGATTFGKNILPRVAALLDVGMVGDVTNIISADTFVRPIYAGNVMATVQSLDKIKVLTVRTTAFAADNATHEVNLSAEKIMQVIPNSLTKFVSQSLTQSKRPELTAARVIISGGRGLKSAENFHLLEEIADKLGAAVGASRAAVDAGFAPNDYQVGQTGKVVAPDLYIAVGISGAIQHLAGMKDSKVIVAINNDPEAPIFQLADYRLVGDLFKILPELKSELDKITT